MATKIPQFVRGSRRANDQYTGPEGSVSLDMDRKALHVHDGETPGGEVWLAFPEAPQDGEHYSRKLGQWVPVPLRPDPTDNGEYIRQANQWVALEGTTWASTITAQLGSLSDRITSQTSRINTLTSTVDTNNQDRISAENALDGKVTAVSDRVAVLEQSPAMSQDKVVLTSEAFDSDAYTPTVTLSVPTDFLLERIYLKTFSSEREIRPIDGAAQLPEGVVAAGGHYYTSDIIYLKDNELRTFEYTDEVDASLVADVGFDFSTTSGPEAHERLTVARGHATTYPYAVVVADATVKCFSTVTGNPLFEETFSSNVLKVRWVEKTHRLLIMLDSPGKLQQVAKVDDVWTTSELAVDVSPGVLETGHNGSFGNTQENGFCALTNADGDLVVYEDATMVEHVNLGSVRSESGVSMYNNDTILFQRPNGQVVHYNLINKEIDYQQWFSEYPQQLSYGNYGTGFRWWATEKGISPYYTVSPVGPLGDYAVHYDHLTRYTVRRITTANSNQRQLISLEPRAGTSLSPKVLHVNINRAGYSVPIRLATDHSDVVRATIEVSHWEDQRVYGTTAPQDDPLLSGRGDLVIDGMSLFSAGPSGSSYQFVLVGHQL